LEVSFVNRKYFGLYLFKVEGGNMAFVLHEKGKAISDPALGVAT